MFHHKRKLGVEVDTKPTICRRCHERRGTMLIQNVLSTATAQPPAGARDWWFCDRCLDEMGRRKPRNS
jgi:hypothetical protein